MKIPLDFLRTNFNMNSFEQIKKQSSHSLLISVSSFSIALNKSVIEHGLSCTYRYPGHKGTWRQPTSCCNALHAFWWPCGHHPAGQGCQGWPRTSPPSLGSPNAWPAAKFQLSHSDASCGRAVQERVRQHPASGSKLLLLCLGIVRKWREIDGKRGWHAIPDLLVYFSHINRPCWSYPGSIQPNTKHRYEKRESNTFKKEPCKTEGKGGMHETWPEAGEIIPSSGRQKRKLNIISFLEREPASLNFKALGRLFTEQCCSQFFVLSFLFLFFFPSVYKGLKFAWSRLAFCWVSSCYFSYYF